MRTKRNFKNINSLKGRTAQLNLYNLMSQRVNLNGVGWINTNDLLTDDLVNEVCDLLGGRENTKRKIYNVLSTRVFSKWYLERIIYSFKRNRFEYIAGQDYTEEVKEIRKDLINRY